MKLEQLKKEHYYHIYNRGINGCSIFKSEKNKTYFLDLVSKYFKDKITVFAYCLLNNHYHLLIQVNSENKIATQALSNLFNAYAKAFNKKYNRTGSLFEKHFKRKQITDEKYLKNTIIYIHKNPEHHSIINNFEEYNFSSFKSILSNNNQLLNVKTVVSWFNDLDNFILSHNKNFQGLQGFQNPDLQGFQNPDLQGFQNPDLQGFQNLVGLNNTTYKVSKTLHDRNNTVKSQFYNYIQTLQNTITSTLETIDGNAKFHEDIWKREQGGGGKTRIIQNGNVFEKGGVNISAVHGKLPKSMQAYFNVGDVDFFACGLSLVLHPKNPMVPTVHANWRYFEMYDKENNVIDSWFGGGQDLTPYYLFEDDAKHFHKTCKTICNKHNKNFYKDYKKRCDEYFWNTHRNEARGVGGLFFDYCKANNNMSMQQWYNFVTDVGDSFLEAYVPIVEKRKNMPYTKANKQWQEIRRGRYVEFNLVHDKGTLFGLKTNGRIESILMSLPPTVQWQYNYIPEKESEEEKLVNVLKTPKDWV